MTSRERAGEIAGWVALGALVVLAAVLRWPLLELGYDADEVGTVTNAGFRAILDNPETGVNPPLWRWLWCLPFSPWDAPWWGRRFSFVCSLLAVGLGGIAGRRASGSWLGGLLAAMLLTAHPWSVRNGGMFRIYAWWTAVALGHLLALGAALGSAGRARVAWLGLAGALAVLLPWIHYFSVPWLLALGVGLLVAFPGQRRWVLLYVPAALGTLPLLPYVLTEEGRRVAPDREPLQHVLVKMASLDLQPPAELYAVVGRALQALTGTWPPSGHFMVALTLGVLGVGLLGARWLAPVPRLWVLAHAGALVTVAVLSQVQYVRPPTLGLLVAVAGPALAAVTSLVPRPSLRAAVLLALLAAYGWGLPARLQGEARLWTAEAGIPTFVATWRSQDARRGDRPVIVAPAHSLWTLWFHLAHEVPRRAPKGEGCAGWNPCFTWEGVTFAGVDPVGDGAALDGLLLHVDPHRPPDLAARCTAISDAGTWGLWDCRRGESSP